jgi:hypothetical protein
MPLHGAETFCVVKMTERSGHCCNRIAPTTLRDASVGDESIATFDSAHGHPPDAARPRDDDGVCRGVRVHADAAAPDGRVPEDSSVRSPTYPPPAPRVGAGVGDDDMLPDLQPCVVQELSVADARLGLGPAGQAGYCGGAALAGRVQQSGRRRRAPVSV